MAIAIFFALCMAGLIFMLCVLVHFVADSRRRGSGRGWFAREPWRGPAVHLGRFRAEKIVAFRQSPAQRRLARNNPSGDEPSGLLSNAR